MRAFKMTRSDNSNVYSIHSNNNKKMCIAVQ